LGDLERQQRPPVPTENSESSERSRVLGRIAVVSPACSSSCVRSSRVLPPLPSSGCSRTGEPGAPSPSARAPTRAAGSAPGVRDRPLAVGLALPIVAALSGHDGVSQAGHGRSRAPSGFPPVLALALEIRTAVSGSRISPAGCVCTAISLWGDAVFCAAEKLQIARRPCFWPP
jgi:hypothetical protein